MYTTARTSVLVLLFVAVCPATGSMAVDLPADIHFNQCDSRWGSDPMGVPGVCQVAICDGGTLMTCIAMLLSWVAGEPDSPNPGMLNTWLQDHGGYVDCSLIYGVADNYDGDGSGLEWRESHGLSFDDWARLDAELAAGDRMPLVAVSYGGLWVVVYDRLGPSGIPSSYRVLDPSQPYSPERTLAAYPSGGRTIFGLAEFSGVFPVGFISGVEDLGPPAAHPTLRVAPNPFNPRTTLSFALEQDEDVTLAIYSVRGELVRQLVNERMDQGTHSVVWDGTDRRGSGVASGVYLARFTAGSLKMSQRLVLMR
jgi:hypothetical protein